MNPIKRENPVTSEATGFLAVEMVQKRFLSASRAESRASNVLPESRNLAKEVIYPIKDVKSSPVFT